MSPIVAAARQEHGRAAAGGVDGIIYSNQGDRPYRRRRRVEQATAMAAWWASSSRCSRMPFGDRPGLGPLATLAVGKAVGAAFVREVFIGVYESDMGQLRPDPGAAFAYRHSIGADDIAIFTNLTPEFASPLGTRTVADRAQGAHFFGCSAALISGRARASRSGSPTWRRPRRPCRRCPYRQHRRPPRHRSSASSRSPTAPSSAPP